MKFGNLETVPNQIWEHVKPVKIPFADMIFFVVAILYIWHSIVIIRIAVVVTENWIQRKY